ncbi:hypothetical protein HK097_010840 [Rhizophlyctis rosea]|uniref:GH26 domain-containing protein n=1 Tax=Rhizophlyctis rosea TaxID=64517 RepID=A0AAD5SI01_9FUNG|nr:hypothetical protein HK097_010840 [Rhizophlyctis rosea]
MRSALLAFFTLFTALAGVSAQLAPLEPEDGKLLFGAWYDRLKNDTPIAINTRVGRPLSMFQSDINITETLQLPTQFIEQVDATNTDAILYLTVYPFWGFDRVTDVAIAELADVIGKETNKGRRVFLRYASEMNGAWFRYGQQPAKFLASWRKVIPAVRAKAAPGMLAVVWAPNSSNGYPFSGLEWSVTNTSADYRVLDTNKDGALNGLDDPYSPYYPGDDLVDWVGFSAYHYGRHDGPNSEYPWITNIDPKGDPVANMLEGKNFYGTFNLYTMFCEDGSGGGVQPPVSKGGKPFMLTETGATFHIERIGSALTPPRTGMVALPPGPGRASIKEKWWQQFMNSTFLTRFPKFKAACTFEFQKFEEETLRDFTTLGPNPGTFDPRTMRPWNEDQPVLDRFKADVPGYNFVVWSQATPNGLKPPAPVANNTNSNTNKGGDNKGTGHSAVAGAPKVVGGAGFVTLLAGLLAALFA